MPDKPINRKSALVLPGIGDLHWVALKLQSFKAAHGIDELDVWIWDFAGKPRSLDYLQRLPFVNAMGYWKEPRTPETEPAFRAVYFDGTQDIIEGFADRFDYLIAVNGSLRKGRNIVTDILPQYAVDWNYPVTIKDGGMRMSQPYVLLYFSDDGMFRHWLKDWDVKDIQIFISELSTALPDHKLIMTGSDWDVSFAQSVNRGIARDLVGMTSLDQLLSMIANADGFAGWCGGNTMVSTHLGTPTYMLWSDYFCEDMRYNWVDPSKLGNIYRCDDVAKVSPKRAAERFAEQVLAERPSREAVTA